MKTILIEVVVIKRIACTCKGLSLFYFRVNQHCLFVLKTEARNLLRKRFIMFHLILFLGPCNVLQFILKVVTLRKDIVHN